MRLVRLSLGALSLALLAACSSNGRCCHDPCPSPCAQVAVAPRPVPPTADADLADDGWSEREGEMDETLPRWTPGLGSGAGSVVDAKFRGTDRKAAKTSIANAPMENFASVAALVQHLTTDHPDSAMRNRQPPISKDSTSNRLEEEKHNVSVDGFLIALKFEDDQDWHLIVGSTATSSSSTQDLLNCEVSGLPANSAASFATLKQARHQLADLFAGNPTTSSAYKKLGTPIHVHIEGSTFYDIDHAPGVVGPTGFRPNTAWEIHPVTTITKIP